MSAIIAAYDDHNKNWKTVLDEKKKERYVLFYLVRLVRSDLWFIDYKSLSD